MSSTQFEVPAERVNRFGLILQLIGVQRAQGKVHVLSIRLELGSLDERFLRFLVVAHFFMDQAEGIEGFGIVGCVCDGLLSCGQRFVELREHFQPEVAFEDIGVAEGRIVFDGMIEPDERLLGVLSSL